MGLSGISKSQVSKLCKNIDERVNAFLDRPLEGEWPYLGSTRRSCETRPHRLGRRDNRHGSIERWSARDRWLWHRPLGGGAVLVGLSEEPGQAWSEGRQAGDLRPTTACAMRSPACSARPGSGVEFIGSETPWRMFPRANIRCSPPRSDKPSCRPVGIVTLPRSLSEPPESTPQTPPDPTAFGHAWVAEVA